VEEVEEGSEEAANEKETRETEEEGQEVVLLHSLDIRAPYCLLAIS